MQLPHSTSTPSTPSSPLPLPLGSSLVGIALIESDANSYTIDIAFKGQQARYKVAKEIVSNLLDALQQRNSFVEALNRQYLLKQARFTIELSILQGLLGVKGGVGNSGSHALTDNLSTSTSSITVTGEDAQSKRGAEHFEQKETAHSVDTLDDSCKEGKVKGSDQYFSDGDTNSLGDYLTEAEFLNAEGGDDTPPPVPTSELPDDDILPPLPTSQLPEIEMGMSILDNYSLVSETTNTSGYLSSAFSNCNNDRSLEDAFFGQAEAATVEDKGQLEGVLFAEQNGFHDYFGKSIIDLWQGYLSNWREGESREGDGSFPTDIAVIWQAFYEEYDLLINDDAYSTLSPEKSTSIEDAKASHSDIDKLSSGSNAYSTKSLPARLVDEGESDSWRMKYGIVKRDDQVESDECRFLNMKPVLSHSSSLGNILAHLEDGEDVCFSSTDALLERLAVRQNVEAYQEVGEQGSDSLNEDELFSLSTHSMPSYYQYISEAQLEEIGGEYIDQASCQAAEEVGDLGFPSLSSLDSLSNIFEEQRPFGEVELSTDDEDEKKEVSSNISHYGVLMDLPKSDESSDASEIEAISEITKWLRIKSKNLSILLETILVQKSLLKEKSHAFNSLNLIEANYKLLANWNEQLEKVKEELEAHAKAFTHNELDQDELGEVEVVWNQVAAQIEVFGKLLERLRAERQAQEQASLQREMHSSYQASRPVLQPLERIEEMSEEEEAAENEREVQQKSFSVPVMRAVDLRRKANEEDLYSKHRTSAIHKFDSIMEEDEVNEEEDVEQDGEITTSTTKKNNLINAEGSDSNDKVMKPTDLLTSSLDDDGLPPPLPSSLPPVEGVMQVSGDPLLGLSISEDDESLPPPLPISLPPVEGVMQVSGDPLLGLSISEDDESLPPPLPISLPPVEGVIQVSGDALVGLPVLGDESKVIGGVSESGEVATKSVKSNAALSESNSVNQFDSLWRENQNLKELYERLEMLRDIVDTQIFILQFGMDSDIKIEGLELNAKSISEKHLELERFNSLLLKEKRQLKTIIQKASPHQKALVEQQGIIELLLVDVSKRISVFRNLLDKVDGNDGYKELVQDASISLNENNAVDEYEALWEAHEQLKEQYWFLKVLRDTIYTQEWIVELGVDALKSNVEKSIAENDKALDDLASFVNIKGMKLDAKTVAENYLALEEWGKLLVQEKKRLAKVIESASPYQEALLKQKGVVDDLLAEIKLSIDGIKWVLDKVYVEQLSTDQALQLQSLEVERQQAGQSIKYPESVVVSDTSREELMVTDEPQVAVAKEAELTNGNRISISEERLKRLLELDKQLTTDSKVQRDVEKKIGSRSHAELLQLRDALEKKQRMQQEDRANRINRIDELESVASSLKASSSQFGLDSELSSQVRLDSETASVSDNDSN